MTGSGLRRVVVTGLGAVTPIGNTVPDFWGAMRRAQVGVGPLVLPGDDHHDLKIQIAAQVKDFDAKGRLKTLKRDKLLPYADRYSQFAAAAADEAVTMAGLQRPFEDPYRVACIIGSGGAGLVAIEDAYRDLFIKKKKATNPLTLIRIIGSSGAAHVGIEFGVKGPVFATCSACSTAAHAIGIGRDYIQHGLVDVAVVGASEAVISYGTMRSWQAMHVLSPEGIFPFAKRRNGTVLGEGAGILVLESLEHAKARGATILAELAGFGMTADSKDMVNPDIEGPSEAMQLALADARLQPEQIDYLNAHGTATEHGDIAESQATFRIFGQKAPVSSLKGHFGHTLGACGALESWATIQMMHGGWFAPTRNLKTVDERCGDLDYVLGEGRKLDIGLAMNNNFAFGGINTSLIIKRWAA